MDVDHKPRDSRPAQSAAPHSHPPTVLSHRSSRPANLSMRPTDDGRERAADQTAVAHLSQRVQLLTHGPYPALQGSSGAQPIRRARREQRKEKALKQAQSAEAAGTLKANTQPHRAELKQLEARLESALIGKLAPFKKQKRRSRKSAAEHQVHEDDPIGLISVYKNVGPEVKALRFQFDELRALIGIDKYPADSLLGTVETILRSAERIVASFRRRVGQQLQSVGGSEQGLPAVLPDSRTVEQSGAAALPVIDEVNLSQFEDLDESFVVAPPDPSRPYMHNGDKSRAATLQQNRRVRLKGGPWNNGGDNHLRTIESAWDQLPGRHVRHNPYLQEAHIKDLDENGEPSVLGLMERTQINYYNGSTGAPGTAEGTMVHETGHAVHSKSYDQLENLIAAVGWQDRTEASAERQALQDGEQNSPEFLDLVRAQGSASTAVHVFTKTGDNFYIRPIGTIPGDEHIGIDAPTADQNIFSYARTAPHELFAEYYRMLYESPKLLFAALVAEPDRRANVAKSAFTESKSEKDKTALDHALELRASNLQQWNIMRNLINGTGHAEAAIQMLMRACPVAKKDLFASEAAQCGLPSQVYNLKVVKSVLVLRELLEVGEELRVENLISQQRLDNFSKAAIQSISDDDVRILWDPERLICIAKQEDCARIVKMGGTKEASQFLRGVTEAKSEQAVHNHYLSITTKLRSTTAGDPKGAVREDESSDDGSSDDGWSDDGWSDDARGDDDERSDW